MLTECVCRASSLLFTFASSAPTHHYWFVVSINQTTVAFILISVLLSGVLFIHLKTHEEQVASC